MTTALSEIYWIKANDRRMWVERPTIRRAWTDCKEATGSSMSLKSFQEACDDHCNFYRKERFRRPSRNASLTERDWSRVSVFLKQNWEVMRGESEEFVLRFMSLNRIPINAKLLAGCATYIELRNKS